MRYGGNERNSEVLKWYEGLIEGRGKNIEIREIYGGHMCLAV